VVRRGGWLVVAVHHKHNVVTSEAKRWRKTLDGNRSVLGPPCRSSHSQWRKLPLLIGATGGTQAPDRREDHKDGRNQWSCRSRDEESEPAASSRSPALRSIFTLSDHACDFAGDMGCVAAGRQIEWLRRRRRDCLGGDRQSDRSRMRDRSTRAHDRRVLEPSGVPCRGNSQQSWYKPGRTDIFEFDERCRCGHAA